MNLSLQQRPLSIVSNQHAGLFRRTKRTLCNTQHPTLNCHALPASLFPPSSPPKTHGILDASCFTRHLLQPVTELDLHSAQGTDTTQRPYLGSHAIKQHPTRKATIAAGRAGFTGGIFAIESIVILLTVSYRTPPNLVIHPHRAPGSPAKSCDSWLRPTSIQTSCSFVALPQLAEKRPAWITSRVCVKCSLRKERERHNIVASHSNSFIVGRRGA